MVKKESGSVEVELGELIPEKPRWDPNWPAVTIGVLTYDRPAEIVRTVSALQAHIRYPGELRWLVVDDSTPGDYLDVLGRKRVFKEVNTRFVSTEHNGGWGAAANLLNNSIDTEFLYFTEDDYVLEQTLDLAVGIALLLARPAIGLLRYAGTAGTHVVLHHMEADVTQWLPEWYHAFGYVPGKATYLQLDGGSPDLYLYSNRPHLKRRSFHQFYGQYPEGLKLGETEERFAHAVKTAMQLDPINAPGIAILPEWIPMWYSHIGKSYKDGATDTNK